MVRRILKRLVLIERKRKIKRRIGSSCSNRGLKGFQGSGIGGESGY